MSAGPILGKQACTNLNLVKRVGQIQCTPTTSKDCTSITACKDFEAILAEFPDVFGGVGRLPGTYSISLKDGATPSISSPRKIPLALVASIKSELESMEKDGIIAHVTELTDWVHPIVVVPRKNGSVRICLDRRKLNAALKREHYKIPTEEEVLSNLV
ncbi:uncharacterized protein LOC135395070 [Ornithodoros turicata]|uniref:uncharacterized protein LOC135395070 n=1 Tax=Ornithodoros turicata TaxID=34597 RepID=UPI00313867F9